MVVSVVLLNEMFMTKIVTILKKNNGYASLQKLKEKGIHTDTIRDQLERGIIEKVKPGLYKLVDMPISADIGKIDVCAAMPMAVVCLHSALSYYDLTTTVPSEVMIALPRDVKPAKISYPPIRVFHFIDKIYAIGIKQIKTPSGNFKIYEIEKTIIDCFRFRNKLGQDVAMEGLKNYFSRSDFDLNKMIEYAEIGKIFSVMKPYMEAVLQR